MPVRLKNASDLGNLEQSISTTAKAPYHHCLTYYLRKSAYLSLYPDFFIFFITYYCEWPAETLGNKWKLNDHFYPSTLVVDRKIIAIGIKLTQAFYNIGQANACREGQVKVCGKSRAIIVYT